MSQNKINASDSTNGGGANPSDVTGTTVGTKRGLDNAIIESVLPSGAATEAKQDDMITELELKADLTETQPVTNLGTLVNEDWDYVAPVYATTTDTYAYKTGGSGGATVATITITYTDSNKDVIQSVART